jgi:DNA-binding transcriptional ArsR family regulator
MRSEAPALAPIFRSQHQAQLLATLLLRPDREYTITELAQLVGVPLSTIHREVERLVRAGILRDRLVGRARLLSANTDSRLARPLTELLAVTYGPLAVVGEEFGSVDHVDLVLIYGSWAARYRGHPGPPPLDIDVLLVGAPARSAVYDAAEHARERLGIPVNPIISSRRRWLADGDALIQQIKSSPSVVVVDRSRDVLEAGS